MHGVCVRRPTKCSHPKRKRALHWRGACGELTAGACSRITTRERGPGWWRAAERAARPMRASRTAARVQGAGGDRGHEEEGEDEEDGCGRVPMPQGAPPGLLVKAAAHAAYWSGRRRWAAGRWAGGRGGAKTAALASRKVTALGAPGEWCRGAMASDARARHVACSARAGGGPRRARSAVSSRSPRRSR